MYRYDTQRNAHRHSKRREYPGAKKQLKDDAEKLIRTLKTSWHNYSGTGGLVLPTRQNGTTKNLQEEITALLRRAAVPLENCEMYALYVYIAINKCDKSTVGR